uniref:Copper transport protein ATOX1 n=1 Tax=Arion vulgaris TaxID=1028688 RepID=A0A0B7BD31_9EUPU
MAEQVYEFQMAMTCEGCAAAAKRVLGKLPEVSNIETSVEKQRVFVTSKLPPQQLLETLQKTGKECTYIGEK